MPPRIVSALLALVVLPACGSRAPVPVTAEAPPAARVIGTAPADPSTMSEPAVTFAVWADGALPPAVLRAAREVDGIVSAGATATGLTRLRAIEGEPRRSDAVRKLSVLAVDPAPLAFDPGLSRVAAALRGGEAAVSELTAQRYGIHKGDLVYIGDGRTSIRVTASLHDEALFAHDLIVPLDLAGALRLSRSPAVIVAALPAAVPKAAKTLVDASGDKGRIRALIGYTGDGGTVMPIEQVHRIFGRFRYVRGPGDSIIPDPEWVRAAIVDWKVPVLGRVRCHRNMVGQLAYAMAEIERAGLAPMIESYDGCYVPRFQRLDDTKLSAHAYGIAVDFNAATNGQGDATPEIDPRIVAIMERWGFAWGGRFSTPDGMHFEISRIVRLPR